MTPTPAGAPRRPLSTDTVTISEAATLTGRDHSTIKRDLRAGSYGNARQDDAGVWQIPVLDLEAAGRLAPGTVETAREEIAAAREARETRRLRDALVHAEAQLVAARELVEELRADKKRLQGSVDTLHALLKKAA